MARVGTKGEDTSDCGINSCKCAVVTGLEASLDASAIYEGEEGDDEMVRVGDRV